VFSRGRENIVRDFHYRLRSHENCQPIEQFDELARCGLFNSFATLKAFVISIGDKAGTNIACFSRATDTLSAQSLCSSGKAPSQRHGRTDNNRGQNRRPS
jgi:hypothetical protein